MASAEAEADGLVATLGGAGEHGKALGDCGVPTSDGHRGNSSSGMAVVRTHCPSSGSTRSASISGELSCLRKDNDPLAGQDLHRPGNIEPLIRTGHVPVALLPSGPLAPGDLFVCSHPTPGCDELAEPVMPHRLFSSSELEHLFPSIGAPPEVDNPDLSGGGPDLIFEAGMRKAADIAEEMNTYGRTKRHARVRPVREAGAE